MGFPFIVFHLKLALLFSESSPCLLILCVQDYTKTAGWIFTKLCGKMESELKKVRFGSAVELDKGPQFYHFCPHFKRQHFANFR